MCIAIPAQVISIKRSPENKESLSGTVDIGGVKRDVVLGLVKDVKEGDYVLIHAGYAIQTIDESEALATWELWKEFFEKESQ